jgi:N-acetyl-S-(2-succino)cysteine monooxygenase
MVSNEKNQMKLGAFIMSVGHHVAAWRHPEAGATDILNIDFYKNIAQTAERGKFDMLFLADVLSVQDDDASLKYKASICFEPLTLLSALSTVTKHIGLAATISTSYNEPFHIARKVASLDHISKGRAAWNVVTSNLESEALNFNRKNHLEHAVRYERASEFLEVVKGLWDSWEKDALIIDKKSGVFADEKKVHTLNHQKRFFSVKGPLNISNPPQSHPVIIQAGSSEAGKQLAAETADVIFTAWQTLEEAQAFYKEVKSLVGNYGRFPEDLKIMPGVLPIIGKTEQEAKEKEQLLQELVLPELGVSLLSGLLGIDLSPYPIDGPLPDLPNVDEINGGKSRYQLLLDLANREKLTIRQLSLRIAGARGHRTIKGTAEQIADQLEEWFINDAADGFNIMPPYFPGGLEDFVDLVIPELQRRGLFRSEYTGKTLRDHLGLKRPGNQFANLLQQA